MTAIEPTSPQLPGWLIDAAHHTDAYGTALGFAAAGYVAGWNDAERQHPRRPTGTGWPSRRDGVKYEREDPMTADPLPPGVVGFSIGGRS